MNTAGVARFPDRQSCRTAASSCLQARAAPQRHSRCAGTRSPVRAIERGPVYGSWSRRPARAQVASAGDQPHILINVPPQERRIDGQHGAWELHGRELFAHNLHLWLGLHPGCRQGLHPADLAHPPEAAAGLAAGGKGGLASPEAANVPRKAARASAWRPGQSSIDPATGIPGWTVSAMSGGARPRRPEIPAERLPTWACRCRTPWGGLWRCRTCPRRWLSRQPCSATVHA